MKCREWGQWKALGPAFIEGGQGRLYNVIDKSGIFPGEYVLKELKNPKRLERFNSEIQAIATLDKHNNVITMVDSGIYRDPRKPCYVMPKADSTLDDLVKDKSIEIERKLKAFDGVCEGVSYLHSKSIIHRDLKPENILIFDGLPKVTDFGLCLIAELERVTDTSEAVGARFYMAPELEDGKRLDVNYAADVYSLGKILYFILSGGKIFSREKHKQKNWQLEKIHKDPRMNIFDSIFNISIIEQPNNRAKNAEIFKQKFRESLNEFTCHPYAKIITRFGSIENTANVSADELRCLGKEEWAVLLKYAKENVIYLNRSVINLACELIDGRSASIFSDIVFSNEFRYDDALLSKAAKKLLTLRDVDPWFGIFRSHNGFSRLAMLALLEPDIEILNTIAKSNMFTLRTCEDVIREISHYFHDLDEEAKYNFLLSSMNTSYEDKENFLVSIVDDSIINSMWLMPLIGNLCNCATSNSVKTIHDLVNDLTDEDKNKSIVQGIALGWSNVAATFFNEYKWKNRFIEIIVGAMNEAVDKEDLDNNSIETDEE